MVAATHDADGVATGWRLGRRIGAQVGGGTGPVVDHQRLPSYPAFGLVAKAHSAGLLDPAMGQLTEAQVIRTRGGCMGPVPAHLPVGRSPFAAHGARRPGR